MSTRSHQLHQLRLSRSVTLRRYTPAKHLHLVARQLPTEREIEIALQFLKRGRAALVRFDQEGVGCGEEDAERRRFGASEGEFSVEVVSVSGCVLEEPSSPAVGSDVVFPIR